MRVSIHPRFEGPDRGEGGIRRWVEAQNRLLPQFGIEIVDRPDAADIVVCHAGDLVATDRPIVAHNHGVYNTQAQSWDRWAWMLNSNVIELLRVARAVTAPSHWVAKQLARGASVRAHILHAGVDIDQWTRGSDGGYVLWNKTRVDPVCDPTPLNRLARANPRVKFVSTYGDRLPNVQMTGRLPFPDAQTLIRNASVYLSTSHETFGISTLEAMASGVPVLGWAFAGNLDIVRHGETGYLARQGDYDDLQHGLEACVANRAAWGDAARTLVADQFTWERAIEQCANLYRDVYTEHYVGAHPKVSIIVTCYNLEQYLDDCLSSVRAQTNGDWECIVVDDCSPGPCREIVARWSAADPRFRYARTPQNRYLAGARNFGVAESSGRYILCLDADDMLNERAVDIMSSFLDSNRGIHIAYGAFELIEPDGRRWISTWPRQFSWEQQMDHKNQLYYASMYRREVWERTGGYRERCRTAEDADFWCRVTSYGFRPYRCTDYPCLLYRNRPDSMSHAEGDTNWTAWFPWSRDRNLTPFAAVGTPIDRHLSWPVSTYTPEVSIIIPVGPGHERLVIDALDSVAAQTFPLWEVIVVNDTNEELRDVPPAHPWATVVNSPRPGSGPAACRNQGIALARTEFFVCLDADDYLEPEYLEKCLRTVRSRDCGQAYAYTDWFRIDKDGASEIYRAPDYDANSLWRDGLSFSVTCLVPKRAWVDVGGFDTTAGASSWEDWDFFFALATKGYHGVHIPQPLFSYRFWSGRRREDAYNNKGKNADALRRKWSSYIGKEGILMGCSSCARRAAKQQTSAPTVEPTVSPNGMVLMEYTGSSLGTRTVRGPSGANYRMGATASRRQFWVYDTDVQKLSALPDVALAASSNHVVEEEVAAVASPLDVRQSVGRVMREEMANATA